MQYVISHISWYAAAREHSFSFRDIQYGRR